MTETNTMTASQKYAVEQIKKEMTKEDHIILSCSIINIGGPIILIARWASENIKWDYTSVKVTIGKRGKITGIQKGDTKNQKVTACQAIYLNI